MQKETRNCQNCKKDFVIEPEDFSFYEKIKVPPPTFCPECRLVRRMLWRNERNLFRRKSGKTGEEIFSTYSPFARVNTWESSIWYGDDWDQGNTGRDYDFSKPFFDQFKELLEVAPIPARTFIQLINSDYCANTTYAKNCYLVFGSAMLEDVSYSENTTRSRNCNDCSFCADCEFCYEGIFNHRSFHALFSSFCDNCMDIYFCKNCVDCSDCLGCVNLRNKKYCIFNKQYTKEEYKEKIKNYYLSTREGVANFKKLFGEFIKKFPVRCNHNFKNEICSGEYITNSRNVKKSYYVDGGENLKYCHFLYAKPNRDSYDQFQWGNNSELMYECTACGGDSSQIKFCQQVFNNSFDVLYSFVCVNAHHCFGCVGIRGKEYCILNKQYSKKEYEELLPKIIKHMNDMPYIDKVGRIYKYGEYFPPEIGPFAYNETRAQEFFPLSKGQIEKEGFLWRKIERRNFTTTLTKGEIPKDILQVDNSILSQVLTCEDEGKCNHECNGVFKIIESELQFYKKLNIPLPRLCPQCRYFERLKQINPIKFFHRKCMCNKQNHYNHDKVGPCQNEFETSYSPDRPEIIYCEKCYNQEVY